MKNWSQRPIEITSLLNPAFCCMILQHVIWKYQLETKQGLPFAIAFLILPLILHQDTRNLMPEKSTGKLLIWLQNHPEILVNFMERTKSLIPITKEAIMFGTNYGNLLMDKQGNLLISNFEPKKEEDDLEVRDCYKKSIILGSWFSTGGTPSTIYSIFGVSP